MPKIPRDISGKYLCKLLSKYGYNISRQTGSHIKLTSEFKGYKHHITIPNHDAIKIGTLNFILNDVAYYLTIQKSDLINDLF